MDEHLSVSWELATPLAIKWTRPLTRGTRGPRDEANADDFDALLELIP